MSELTTHAGASHDGHEGFSHPMPVWQLLTVFGILIFLTIATVVQSTLDLGNLELWVSLVIATVKALLVMLFFMHMIHDKPFNVIVFMSSFIFVALFIGITLMDAHNYKDVVEVQETPAGMGVAEVAAPEGAPAK